MRSLYRRFLFLFVGPALACGVCTAASAASMQRVLEVINAGTEPVYAIRVGHRATGVWSDDLLGSTDVVDVGEAARVSLPLRDTCWYDVRTQYRDGHAAEIDQVDLCSVMRLFFKH